MTPFVGKTYILTAIQIILACMHSFLGFPIFIILQQHIYIRLASTITEVKLLGMLSYPRKITS